MRNIYSRNSLYKLVIDLFTEGKKTESQYIKDFIEQQAKKDKVRSIWHGKNSDAVNLVSDAIRYTKNLGIEKGDAPRQTWVVFDHDNNEEIVVAAIKKESDYNSQNPYKKIYVAFMKPCMELWGLMHFKNKNLPITSSETQSQLHDFMPSYNHQGNPIFKVNELTNEGYNQAVRLATSWNASLDNKENPNSSSHFAGIYKLTEKIKSVS